MRKNAYNQWLLRARCAASAHFIRSSQSGLSARQALPAGRALRAPKRSSILAE